MGDIYLNVCVIEGKWWVILWEGGERGEMRLARWANVGEGGKVWEWVGTRFGMILYIRRDDEMSRSAPR